MLVFHEKYSSVQTRTDADKILLMSMDMSTNNRKKLTPDQLIAIETVVAEYDGKKIELDYGTPFQLLCSVILSAQSTDKQVNKITPPFFAKVRDSKDVVDMPLADIENHLRYVNYFRNKSRFIKETGTILAKKYGGVIPNDLILLQTFP
jgi:endonuclease-3